MADEGMCMCNELKDRLSKLPTSGVDVRVARWSTSVSQGMWLIVKQV